MYDFDYDNFSDSGQSYNIVQCRQGWTYDVQDIGHSIISEVLVRFVLVSPVFLKYWIYSLIWCVNTIMPLRWLWPFSV